MHAHVNDEPKNGASKRVSNSQSISMRKRIARSLTGKKAFETSSFSLSIKVCVRAQIEISVIFFLPNEFFIILYYCFISNANIYNNVRCVLSAHMYLWFGKREWSNATAKFAQLPNFRIVCCLFSTHQLPSFYSTPIALHVFDSIRFCVRCTLCVRACCCFFEFYLFVRISES